MDDSREKIEAALNLFRALFRVTASIVEFAIKIPTLNMQINTHKKQIENIKQDININEISYEAKKKFLQDQLKAVSAKRKTLEKEVQKEIDKAKSRGEIGKSETIQSLTARMVQAKQRANEHNATVAPQQKGISMGMSR